MNRLQQKENILINLFISLVKSNDIPVSQRNFTGYLEWKEKLLETVEIEIVDKIDFKNKIDQILSL